MPDAYRDSVETLLVRNRALEDELEALKRDAASQEAVFQRLQVALDGKAERRPPKPRVRSLVGCLVAAAAVVGAAFAATQAGRTARAAEPQVVPMPAGDLCATPGVKLTVDGSDAFAPAATTRDQAGHKYRKGGQRSAWFTVNGDEGNLYVHGVGDFLGSDVGPTSLSLLAIVTKGETGGYTLARGGRSFLEVTRSDGAKIAGRFEADMSKVSDTTREPPFGTPVVRVRGTFCLPARPANPNDTGP